MTQTALEREQILRQVALAESKGISQNKIAFVLGVSSANISRWRRAYLAGGLAALEPDRTQSGRKPLAVLNESEQTLVKHLAVKLESKTQALRMLADSPQCRPEVAEVIRARRSSKHTLTPTLRGQAHVDSQVVNFYKSPRRTRINCFINPRTLTYLDAGGTEKKIEPGDLFERDDMSNNFIGWVEWPWRGDPCSEKFGVRPFRGQNLLQIDVGSLFFPSFNFLIRPKDSYRADDIWQWVATTYREIGMPRIGERWERGTWAAKKLRGDQEARIEAGHTDEDARLGGMAALGLRVIESQSPTTKIIENRFNFLQKVMATIPGQIGRRQGEFEKATKLWMQCRAGQRDPRDHFLSFEKLCDEIEKRLHYVNWEPVEGVIYHGVPAALWQQGTGAEPLKKLEDDQGWLFARDKREVTAAKAHVMVRFTRDDKSKGAHWFHHENLWRFEGEKIAVYFDSYIPENGATLVCLTGRNSGTVIGHAECIDGCPQFALAAGMQDESGYQRRRDFSDAVISEVRTLGLRNTLSRVRSADNGEGGRVEISKPSAVVSGGARSGGRRAAGGAESIVDEAAEINRIERLEAAARERGDILPA